MFSASVRKFVFLTLAAVLLACGRPVPNGSDAGTQSAPPPVHVGATGYAYGPTYVFRPGAVQAGNVYPVWADLAPVLAAIPGWKSVLIDPSLGAAHATAGTWNIDNISFVSEWNSTGTLIVDDGCHFTGTRFDLDGVLVQSNATTVVLAQTLPFAAVTLANASGIQSTTATPFMSVASGSVVNVYLTHQAYLGDGTHPALQSLSGGQLIVAVAAGDNNANVAANSLTGAGAVSLWYDSTGTQSLTQTVSGTFTTVNQSQATRLPYTPIASGNWPQGPPTTVATGLDRIAAGGSSATPTIVFRPSGVAGGNVYTTWATFYAAGHQLTQPFAIIDDSLGTAATTSGAYNLSNWTFSSVAGAFGTANGGKLTWVTGSTISEATNLHLRDGVQFVSTSTAPIFNPTSGLRTWYLDGNGTQLAGSAAGGGVGTPFVKNGVDFGFTLLMDGATQLGDLTHNAVNTDSAKNTIITVGGGNGSGGTIYAHALGGAGTAVVGRTAEASVSATQDVSTLSLNNNTLASLVSYTPTTSANWTQSTPTTSAGAMDLVSSGATAATTSLVYQPGGTAGGSTYITWAATAAALARIPGAKTLYIDDHISAAHVTTGSWGVDLTTFTAYYGNCSNLIFDSGAVFTFNQITIGGCTSFQQSAGAAAPVFALGASSFAVINLSGQVNNATIAALGAQPWATAGSGAVLSLMLDDNANLGDGTHNVFNALSGGTVLAILNGTSKAAAHAFGGAGTTNAYITNASNVVLPQDTTTFNLSNQSNAPGTTPYSPQWYALTDVYWDPVSGGDTNTGQSGHPVKTCAEIVRRYGAIDPILPYGQSLTIHQLSAQAAGVDPCDIEPHLSGGGQFIIDSRSAWVSAGANFSAGTLGGGWGSAGAVPTAGGSEMTMASVPAYVVANVLLFNSTRSSYAFVDSVAGGTAKLSQPQTQSSVTTTTAIPNPVADNDWVAGDTIQAWTIPNLNWKRLSGYGGDVTSGGQPSAVWMLGASVADSSGNGGSEFPIQNQSANAVASLCVFPGRVHASSPQGRGFGTYLIGSVVRTAAPFYGGGQMAVLGGVVNAPSALAGTLEFFQNAVIHGSWGPATGSQIIVSTGGAYSDGTLTVQIASQVTIGGGVILWGSYSVVNSANGTFLAGSAFATNALLTTGSITFASDGHNNVGTAISDNGTPFGLFPLTPANLDLYGGLVNLNTGARYWTSTALTLTPAYWTNTDVYYDPVSGSDTANGTTSGTALKTCEGLVAKYGTDSPRIPFGQNLTIHQLSGDTLNASECSFSPQMSGGGYFAWVGTLTQVCTIAANTATVTTQSRGGPGTRWAITNMCGGAAAKNLIEDTTQSPHTWVTIDSIVTGTATVSQPLSATLLTTITSPAPTESSIATNDAFTVWSQPLVNAKNFRCKVGDVSSGGAFGVCWYQDLEFADSSTSAASEYPLIADGLTVYSRVRFDGRVHASMLAGRGSGLVLMGDDETGGFNQFNGAMVLYGGVYRSTISANASGVTIAGDAAIHGALTTSGLLKLGASTTDGVFSDSSVLSGDGATIALSGPIWGSATVSASQHAWVRSVSTNATLLLLTSGALQVMSPSGFVTTGTKYSAGTWTDGQTISAANIHSFGGLQNPITNSGFAED